ncbi:MAG TPA: CoA-binding protein [Gemmatimonadaceae bacterium]|nr:CoA-binding protein [Gemmatimonadaceae bacterium]
MKCNRPTDRALPNGGVLHEFVAGTLTYDVMHIEPSRGDTPAADWRRHLIDDARGIRRILEHSRRIAVLGIKTEPAQPAYYVAEYTQRAGYDVIPVPVYYPDVTQILGQPVYRRVADVPGDVDMVNVFRRPKDIPAHVDDILAKRPKSVWFQLGIRNDEAAERFARAGIEVVQDRCLLVELGRIGR